MEFNFGRRVGEQIGSATDAVLTKVAQGVSTSYSYGRHFGSNAFRTVKGALCKAHQGMAGVVATIEYPDDESDFTSVEFCDESECSYCIEKDA